MTHYDYIASRDIAAARYPFHGLIMAAMRQADTVNATALRVAFPDVWDELQARYDAPGGFLPDELAVAEAALAESPPEAKAELRAAIKTTEREINA